MRSQIPSRFHSLTDKQREALDLLVQHKTSKEISRILGVSPHTIDQRIDTAKKKFGVRSRGELAQAYLRERQIGEAVTYEPSDLAGSRVKREWSASDGRHRASGTTGWQRPEFREPAAAAMRSWGLPELATGPWGTTIRIAVMVILATFLIVALLGGISIYLTLHDILSA